MDLETGRSEHPSAQVAQEEGLLLDLVLLRGHDLGHVIGRWGSGHALRFAVGRFWRK